MILVPELYARPRAELLAAAAHLGLELRPNLEHDELVSELVHAHLTAGDAVWTEGVLSARHEGFGFLRLVAADFAESAADAYVGPRQLRALNLQNGHVVRGPVRAPKGDERYLALAKVESVQGFSIGEAEDTAPFASRNQLAPHLAIALGASGSSAAFSIGAPWRFGQRALVHVPRAFDATKWLRELADALASANPRARVWLCLLDQRPDALATARYGDTVTVVGASFAAPPRRQVDLAELALDAATREVERGADVVLLLDSLTALTHAVARSAAPSGAWIQPGLDAHAVLAAKRLLAAARQTGEGGSLTVVATLREDGDELDRAIARELGPTSDLDVRPAQDGTRDEG